MRLPSVPTLSMVEHLNTTYFHKVWNAPDDHGRANFRLRKPVQRVQIGSVPIDLSVVGLPTTDKVYVVYRAPIRFFGRFIDFPSYQWVKDSDVLNQDSVTISAYASSGRLIPPGKIYLRYDPVKAYVLVAIDKTYTTKCLGQTYPDLYMTVYLDTSRQTPVVSQVFSVNDTAESSSVATVNESIQYAVTTYPAGTFVFVNGWLYNSSNIPSLINGDIVSIITDPDIVGYCDLTVDDNQTGYHSDLFSEYREILHIPKILNPNNYLITNDTLSVGIFDTQTNKGVMGHRIDVNAIESISHNDFSMSRTVLQGFQDSLSAQTIKVRLYVRYPTQYQPLEDDINHLKDLYTLNDLEIKKQLAGLSSNQIAEWTAVHLEQSPFLSLLYKFNGFTNPNVLPQYTAAVGYYDVASTLSQSMHYYTYKGGSVQIKKPVRLRGYPCQVLVYADGRKVPEHSVGLSKGTYDTFELGFLTDSYVKTNSRIAVYVAEGGGLRVPNVFNPTSSNPSIVLDSDDYELVKIFSYSSPQKTWEDTTTKGYKSIPLSPGDYTLAFNSDGTVTYTVKPTHYGSHFYLVPIYSLSTAEYSLDEFIENKEPIVLPLKINDSTGNFVPLVGQYSLEIYVNGYRLVEGLDYTCNPVLGPNSDILQTLLVVSNSDYLSPNNPGNLLEVVVHGERISSRDKGYVIGNKMYRKVAPMIWSASCGRAFSSGLLVENVKESGNYLISSQSLKDGSPYLLEWCIPYGVTKLMGSMTPVSDINLRNRINAVLKLIPPTYPDTVVVDHLHALYSPYLARIVSDVADGTLTIVNEPMDDLFLNQFLKYNFLKDRDPVIGASNTLIDRRFVTLAAHYVNFVVQDPQQMLLVQRLITLLLTPSSLSINEVLV